MHIPVSQIQGAEDPKLKNLEEYPDWLWNLSSPTIGELQNKGLSKISPPEARRYHQLGSTLRIKEKNME